MSKNRIKKSNTLQARRLWNLFAGCFVLTLFVLVYAFLQVKIIRLNEEIDKQKKVLQEIKEKNEKDLAEIRRAKSPMALQQRIQDLDLPMVSISELETPIDLRQEQQYMVARKPRKNK